MISRFTCGTCRPSWPISTESTSSTPTTVWGLPTDTCTTGRSGCVPMAAQLAGASIVLTSPMSTVATTEVLSCSPTVTSRTPASVCKRYTRSPRAASLRNNAWAKQRAPLPLISAVEPSLLYNRMRALTSSMRSSNNKPSAPTPDARLHQARETSGQATATSSTPALRNWATSSTKKSLPQASNLLTLIMVGSLMPIARVPTLGA